MTGRIKELRRFLTAVLVVSGVIRMVGTFDGIIEGVTENMSKVLFDGVSLLNMICYCRNYFSQVVQSGF